MISFGNSSALGLIVSAFGLGRIGEVVS